MLTNHHKTRLAIYIVGVAAQVTSFFVTLVSPELAGAFSQTADVLGAIALTTALTNVNDVTGAAIPQPFTDEV
ncbi:hypothetical protein G7068_16110 [Leucobacter viscericola]|uniref:Holin n=1 Tax=Leucobacter viscericola TaxID=2714935 RepID=A0A6G7XBG5_9MICO|nr:hypothetical protein [Leucobacter viscericola]QIK61789.1 hypothetical protein G7068_00120 [Leucobacter viscericola]QIK64571.1 hypothetical protein G7068_16110 [Leucobacter viscericola]